MAGADHDAVLDVAGSRRTIIRAATRPTDTSATANAQKLIDRSSSGCKPGRPAGDQDRPGSERDEVDDSNVSSAVE